MKLNKGTKLLTLVVIRKKRESQWQFFLTRAIFHVIFHVVIIREEMRMR